MTTSQNIANLIRFVGDGGYGDLFPIFENNTARHYCVDELVNWTRSLGNEVHIDKIVSLEAKGFIIGGMLAERLDLPFAPIVKSERFHEDQKPLREMCLDYSGRSKILEATREHIRDSEHILLVDDWFETGHQAEAAISLIQQCGASVVGICGIIDDTARSGFAKKISSQFPFFCVVKLER